MQPRLFLPILLTATAGAGPVLDSKKLLEAQSFWDNRDFAWYDANIPLLDTPDEELNTTYYYRWELLTKHLTYGSPDTGYVFTEFADRPFWSGTYGAISCPSGLQIYEARWLRDPRYARDYLRYWFHTPGAEPRRYSSWLADSAWNVQLVHPDKKFITTLLPDLAANMKGWEEKSWVPEAEMFWQVGHDDGMEYNITSRQTKDILRGGPSYRPSFNAYMWADLTALAKISSLAGDQDQATQYQRRADELKKQVQEKLWDPKRGFFFPMFRDDEQDSEGNIAKKNTLIYQTGKYAGSPHGRELADYVPWYFNMPDPGHEEAWEVLMNPYYFHSKYGPSTIERNDPQFVLKNTCCWWSGQSWPFATTQTLKALANLLQDYPPGTMKRSHYYTLLHNYALSHRKGGKPYVAEALNPDTGSFEGHDAYHHSEHYFHSGFTDLVITGLAGLAVKDSDTLTINPLAPAEWDYFAMDGIPYRGHLVSILWDSSGERYHRGAGLQVLIDGEAAAHSTTLGKLTAKMPPAKEEPALATTRVNHAVNNDGNYYPRLTASHSGPDSSLNFIQDGNAAWYHLSPPARWTSEGSANARDWMIVDFGTPRRVEEAVLYLLDDGPDHPVVSPAAYEIEYAGPDGIWKGVPDQRRDPEKPEGHTANHVRFPETEATRLRVTFQHQPGKKSGLSEIEAWGPAESPYRIAPLPSGNLSLNPHPETSFPKSNASFSDRFGGTPEKAIDGKLNYRPNPVNRWTSYGSPNATDWLEIDFGTRKRVGRVVLDLYDDGGGVRAPKRYTIEQWTGSEWSEVKGQKNDPVQPKGSAANTVTFPPVEVSKIRVVFTHTGEGDSRSGVTEIEAWEK